MSCQDTFDSTAPLRLARVRDHATVVHRAVPGTVLPNFFIACAVGAIELLEVQAPGGKLLTFDAFRHGRPVRPGAIMTSQSPKIAEAQSS